MDPQLLAPRGSSWILLSIHDIAGLVLVAGTRGARSADGAHDQILNPRPRQHGAISGACAGTLRSARRRHRSVLTPDEAVKLEARPSGAVRIQKLNQASAADINRQLLKLHRPSSPGLSPAQVPADTGQSRSKGLLRRVCQNRTGCSVADRDQYAMLCPLAHIKPGNRREADR